MQNITIDDDVYAYLQEHAIAFTETTPNQVLRRLLGMEPARNPVGGATDDLPKDTVPAIGSRYSGRLTSQERYQKVIVEALKELGGRARTKDVLRRVGEILEDEHTEADLATYSSGGIRWQARASSEALVLRNKGILNKDAAHGWWELTEEGENQTDE